MVIKNWFDIVICPDFFRIIEFNNTPGNKFDKFGLDALNLGTGNWGTVYNHFYAVRTVPIGFPTKPPSFFSVTDIKNKQTPYRAIWYGNVSFFWTNTPGYGKLHREDGFPAALELVNFTMHTEGSKLSRYATPAIEAEYVFASWMENGNYKRNNGPSIVSLERLKDYWRDGNHIKRDVEDMSFRWDTRDRIIEQSTRHMQQSSFLGKLSEFFNEHEHQTDPYSNVFFTNPQTEFFYMTEFGA